MIKNSKKNKSVIIRNFESLRNNSEIPTLDNCKSINKELKNVINIGSNAFNGTISLEQIIIPSLIYMKALPRLILREMMFIPTTVPPKNGCLIHSGIKWIAPFIPE